MPRLGFAIRAAACIAAAACLGSAVRTDAAELICTVRSVDGSGTVTLACEGGQTPRVGDPVTLGFEVPGVGFVAVEGAWSVSLIGPGGEVMAAPAGPDHGQPQVGNLARVESSAAPAPGPPTGAPPAGPGMVVRQIDDQLPPVAYRAHLGVAIESPPGDGEPGVEVMGLTPDGAAESAGVLPGDVILAVDGAATADPASLVTKIQSFRPGTAVRLRVFRFPDVVELEAVLQAPSLDDPDVQAAIGRAYLLGEGVPVDQSKARLWLERAAAGGNAEAAARLGRGPAPGDPLTDFFNQEQTATAAPGDHLRRDLAASRTRVAAAPRGVFVIGAETGNRPAMYLVDPAIRQLVAASGATPLMPPDDIRITPGVVPPPGVIAQIIAGRGALLYLELELKWAAIGFAKDRITVTCYDPSGAKQWSEDASNTFANSRDHSTQILIDKITKKLAKRTGQACLRP